MWFGGAFEPLVEQRLVRCSKVWECSSSIHPIIRMTLKPGPRTKNAVRTYWAGNTPSSQSIRLLSRLLSWSHLGNGGRLSVNTFALHFHGRINISDCVFGGWRHLRRLERMGSGKRQSTANLSLKSWLLWLCCMTCDVMVGG